MYNVVNIFKLPLNADYTDTNKLTTDSFYLFLIHKSVLFGENHNRYGWTTSRTK